MHAVILVFLMAALTSIWGHCNKPPIQPTCEVVKRRGLCLFYDQFKHLVTGNTKRLNRKCCSDGDVSKKAYIVTKNGDKIVKIFNEFFTPMEFDTCAIKGEKFCPKCCKVAVCDPNPCENGGTCSPTDNSYSCNCPTGYLGKLCDVNPCDVHNPCLNNGTCYPSDVGVSCSCPSTFSGINCEINPCDVFNPCLNKGTCYPSEGGVNCSCLPNFPGKYCESKLDCNFDENYCTWRQPTDYGWGRRKGLLTEGASRPENDHTGGGSFIHIILDGMNDFFTRRIESPELIPSASTQCFSFWYHMYGYYMGDLNVYIKTSQTGLGDAVWTRSGDQGNVWIQGYVNLSQIPFPYSIEFESFSGASEESDMSLDDITLVEGECPEV